MSRGFPRNKILNLAHGIGPLLTIEEAAALAKDPIYKTVYIPSRLRLLQGLYKIGEYKGWKGIPAEDKQYFLNQLRDLEYEYDLIQTSLKNVCTNPAVVNTGISPSILSLGENSKSNLYIKI